jgi:DNA primase large subunit
MIRHDANRIDPKRRATIDHKKRQFATPIYKQQEYPHRLNLYDTPPTAEITLEQFEQWAIDRLKGMKLQSHGKHPSTLTLITNIQ